MADDLTYDNVVDVLLARVPELQPVYQELVGEVEEKLPGEQEDDLVEGEWVEPFPKYIFAAYAAWFAEKLAARAAGAPAAAGTLRRLAAVLEEMATAKDPILREMFSAGFVEAMHPGAPGFDYLFGLMGPASRAEVVTWFGPDSVKHHPAE